MVPLRTHFSTILSEINALNTKFDTIIQSIPTIIQSEIQRFKDRRCLTIYGLPEDSTMTEKVNSIFNLVSVSPSSIVILHRLGKYRKDNSPRPLKVSIKEDVSFPRLIDLAEAMKRDSSLSTFHVRKFETPEQRRAGFLARQAKRDATAAVPITLQTTPVLAQKNEIVPETPMHVDSPLEVPRSVSTSSLQHCETQIDPDTSSCSIDPAIVSMHNELCSRFDKMINDLASLNNGG